MCGLWKDINDCTAPAAHPSVLHAAPTCGECGKSLMRCEYCGQYSDEAHDCADPEWYRVKLIPIVTRWPDGYNEGEGYDACPRCAPRSDEDYPEDEA